jgi:hypothetical protein
MNDLQKKEIELRFVEELGELLAKYEIRHRSNSMKDKTLRFKFANEVWGLLSKLFTEPEVVVEPKPEGPPLTEEKEGEVPVETKVEDGTQVSEGSK